jgi:flavin reductase (DIM6/NTAB) family NADH-FMN oxidoreductase RutF
MKIEIESSRYPSLAHPKMCLILTCGREKVNAITLAWHTPISREPPLYGVSVSPRRFSYGIIKEEKEFALNFLNFEHWEKVHYCGTHSGKEEDKIAEAGIMLEPCAEIGTKSIAQAYAVLECTMHDIVRLGDHELFVGEVKRASVEKEFWNGKKLKGVKPVYQLGNYTYTTMDDSSEVCP